jgi:hypothetical protein
MPSMPSNIIKKRNITRWNCLILTTKKKKAMSENVECLPGVGKKTAYALKTAGITTLQQLLNRKESVGNIDIQTLQGSARQFVTPQWSTIQHTWYGSIVHIPRRGKRLTRGTVKNLLTTPYSIELNVEFMDNMKLKRKSMSPISLLAAQILWLSREIVSDSEPEEDILNVPPLQDLLPVLQLTGSPTMDTTLISALRKVVLECKHLSEIISGTLIELTD